MLVTHSCAVCRRPVKNSDGHLINGLVNGGVHYGDCQSELTRRFKLAMTGPVSPTQPSLDLFAATPTEAS